LIAVLLALLLTAGYAVQQLRTRSLHSRADRTARPAYGPVLGAFHRFTARHRASSARAPNETAREYVGRLTPAGRLDGAVATLEQECYGAAAPRDVDVVEAVTAFDTERV
jgi:hypothetical protein